MPGVFISCPVCHKYIDVSHLLSGQLETQQAIDCPHCRAFLSDLASLINNRDSRS